MQSVNRTTSLSAQQREFAKAFILNGGNGSAAAALVMPEATKAAQAMQASRWALHGGIQAEIQRLTVTNLSAKLPQLINKLMGIALDERTDPETGAPMVRDADRIKAITALLDRAGISKAPSSVTNVQINNGPLTGQGAQQLIRAIWETKQARTDALALGGAAIEAQATDNAALVTIDATIDDSLNEVQPEDRGEDREP